MNRLLIITVFFLQLFLWRIESVSATGMPYLPRNDIYIYLDNKRITDDSVIYGSPVEEGFKTICPKGKCSIPTNGNKAVYEFHKLSGKPLTEDEWRQKILSEGRDCNQFGTCTDGYFKYLNQLISPNSKSVEITITENTMNETFRLDIYNGKFRRINIFEYLNIYGWRSIVSQIWRNLRGTQQPTSGGIL